MRLLVWTVLVGAVATMFAPSGLQRTLAATVPSGVPSPGEPTSQVIPEHTKVYAQPSASARVVGSFARGGTLSIDLMITNSEGRWCLCREPGQKNSAGYILCRDLTGTDPEPLATAIPPETNSDGARPLTSNGGTDVIEGWILYLGLSEKQRSVIKNAFESSGVASSRSELEQVYRRYGVTDGASLLEQISRAGRDPTGGFFLAAEPIIRRGGKRFRSFWQVFMNTLTADQKKSLSTRAPTFLLLYLDSQSDPESAFSSYVLGHMRRTGGRPD